MTIETEPWYYEGIGENSSPEQVEDEPYYYPGMGRTSTPRPPTTRPVFDDTNPPNGRILAKERSPGVFEAVAPARTPAPKPVVPVPQPQEAAMPIPLIGGALGVLGSAAGTVGGLAIRGLAASTATTPTPGAALAGTGAMFETGTGASTRALYGGTVRRRRRRRRLLTAQDKADIAFLHGQLGSGQLGKAAISAVLSRRVG